MLTSILLLWPDECARGYYGATEYSAELRILWLVLVRVLSYQHVTILLCVASFGDLYHLLCGFCYASAFPRFRSSFFRVFCIQVLLLSLFSVAFSFLLGEATVLLMACTIRRMAGSKDLRLLLARPLRRGCLCRRTSRPYPQIRHFSL